MRTALREGEKLLYLTKKHWIVYSVVAVVLGVFFLIPKWWVLLIGGAVGLYIHLERRNNIWVVTNQRFIDEWGVFSVNVREVPLEKINNITWSQDLAGRILNWGFVEIQSAADFGSITARFVTNPKKLAYMVQQAQIFKEQESVMECPYCREIIKKEAKICRFCGASLKTESEKPKSEQTASLKEDRKTEEPGAEQTACSLKGERRMEVKRPWEE
ncbi:MAG: PH domain-containing protein [Dictyoglomus turgidum]